MGLDYGFVGLEQDWKLAEAAAEEAQEEKEEKRLGSKGGRRRGRGLDERSAKVHASKVQRLTSADRETGGLHDGTTARLHNCNAGLEDCKTGVQCRNCLSRFWAGVSRSLGVWEERGPNALSHASQVPGARSQVPGDCSLYCHLSHYPPSHLQPRPIKYGVRRHCTFVALYSRLQAAQPRPAWHPCGLLACPAWP